MRRSNPTAALDWFPRLKAGVALTTVRYWLFWRLRKRGMSIGW
jgi:hypothetical protein